MAQPFDWDSLDEAKYCDEAEALRLVLDRLVAYDRKREDIEAAAIALVERTRADGFGGGVVGELLANANLASDQGKALMRICEAFGRAGNPRNRNALLQEQLLGTDWSQLARSGGWAGRALAFAARLERYQRLRFFGINPFKHFLVHQAVSWMAEQFVLGGTIGAALKRAGRERLTCSFDMLGEGARTIEDADRYEAEYASAIDALAAHGSAASPGGGHNVSVKLSALDCRYEAVKEKRAFDRLYPRLERLMLKAAAANIDFYIDAEEADRLVLSLKLLDRLERAAPPNWHGLGLAVQAYQRRALDVIDRLIELARTRGRRLRIRLVKGAYWDSEIRKAQLAGADSFPVFTSKTATDLSYLACAETMLAARPAIYPAFATHNAHTVAAVQHLAGEADGPFEFQRLQGMGKELYAAAKGTRVRVYAPVGKVEELLPYLVRRLLENGANSSFVNMMRDLTIPARKFAGDPLAQLGGQEGLYRPRVVNPAALLGETRRNSAGLDLSVKRCRDAISDALRLLDENPIQAASIVRGRSVGGGDVVRVMSPADRSRQVGTALSAGVDAIDIAFEAALGAQPAWDRLGGEARGSILGKVGDAIEAAMPRLVALLAREAGRTLADGVSEVREAVDFCRYYADCASDQFGAPRPLNGPTGETNKYSLRGRGVIVCISPWNFPLAIFVGQIAAALAAGNAVIAKPAPQTPLIAYEAVQLFLSSGLDPDLLSLLIGDMKLGSDLVDDRRHAGVGFTGSFATARKINRALAARDGPIARLVAETGGLNAIFADETALPEQLIDDVLVSAFGSAGQRCSSARLLVIPEASAPNLRHRLELAMGQLVIGDPSKPDTDVGPIIDEDAKDPIIVHLANMRAKGHHVIQSAGGDHLERGTFMAPVMIEIDSLDGVDHEVFGPVLHVLTYPRTTGAAVSIARALQAKGYALTLGIHTRLEKFEREIREACPAGNIYINRPTIGAVVGVQPFGGFGLSGTGPKAGGPQSLHAYANEMVVSENTTAKGGDLDLLNASA